MDLQHVMASHVFLNGCEAHYACHSRIDSTNYPQVHDFYEIVLVVAGKLQISLNKHLVNLEQGSLMLIREGDIHTKLDCGFCQHINLAFPDYTIKALFYFLYNSLDKLEELSRAPYVPIYTLTKLETTMMQNKVMHLNYMPSDSIGSKNTYLRTILTDIISSTFVKALDAQHKNNQLSNIPAWLIQATDGLFDIHNLEEGFAYLIRVTNRSPEHICRAFRKYLNMTPTTFINIRRLNYAANLLIHSDKEIVDIAFESGFQSISHFYHLFKKEYQTSPLKYKNKHYILHNIY